MTALLGFAQKSVYGKWHALISERVPGAWDTRCGLFINADMGKRVTIPAPWLCKSCEKLLAQDERKEA